MIGQRLPDGDPEWPPPAGAYWRGRASTYTSELVWYVVTPNDLYGCLANHTVTEHEDGTITVTPSILVTLTYPTVMHTYHGFLERGVWREC